MPNPEQGDRAGGTGLVLMVFWASLLCSLGVYLFLGHSVLARVGAVLPESAHTGVRQIVIFIAAVEMAVLFSLRRVFRRPIQYGVGAIQGPPPDVGAAMRKRRARSMLLMGMAESIGALGFILFLLTQDRLTFHVLLGISCLFLLFYWPGRFEFEGIR